MISTDVSRQNSNSHAIELVSPKTNYLLIEKEGMDIMEYSHQRSGPEARVSSSAQKYLQAETENIPPKDLDKTPMHHCTGIKWNDTQAAWRTGEFYQGMSAKAISEFAALAAPFECEGNEVLFTEEQQPCNVFFVLEGRVRLSINSSAGRRLILGSAGPGDILGLTSAVLGSPYEMTAEAQFCCRIASLERQSFLGFLQRFPNACQNVARQLSLECKRGCEQLRTIGLTSCVPARLARLVLEWCAEGRQTERGIRIHCSLTHGEIGEYIGASRETVSRTLTDLRDRELVEQRGSSLLVLDQRALEIFADAG